MTHDEELNPTVLTATMKGNLSGMDAKKANELFSSAISEIAKGCVSHGAIMIGHIKANFVCGKEMLSVSCTTNDGNTRCRNVFSENVGEYRATLNVIAYGVDYHDMEHVVTEELEKIAGEKVFKIIESEDSCHDPECHDCHCHNHGHRHFGE